MNKKFKNKINKIALSSWTFLSDKSNWVVILKHSYIYLILLIVYVPLFFAFVYTFNKPSDKGLFTYRWIGTTVDNWNTFFANGRGKAAINSIILALSVSIINITIGLITVYALYRQKNRLARGHVMSVNNIPLVNPDNITALGLAIVFGIFFGIIGTSSEGFGRLIVGHTIMVLPYGITLMLPRSDKFNNNLYEASQDLGYNKLISWFKTYFVHMIPSILMVGLVSIVFSFDDFIIARTVSNASTLGTRLYEKQFAPWGLVAGSIFLFITLAGNIVYTILARKKRGA